MKASLPKVEEDEDNDDDVDDEDESRVDYSTQDSESDERVLSDTNSEEDEEGSSDGEDDINWEFGGVGLPGVDGSVSSDPLRTPAPAETYRV